MIKVTAKLWTAGYRELFGDGKRITVRLNGWLYERIAAQAQVNISDAVRELLELGLKSKGAFKQNQNLSPIRPTV